MDPEYDMRKQTKLLRISIISGGKIASGIGGPMNKVSAKATGGRIFARAASPVVRSNVLHHINRDQNGHGPARAVDTG